VESAMRTLSLIIFFLTEFCCAVLSGELVTHVDSFSKLKQGDTLIVRFHSSGCFHDETYDLIFRRTPELAVSIVHLPCEAIRPALIDPQTNRVDLGTLTLSKSDIAGLDKLMDFYRSNREGGCTTLVKIAFTQQRDGKTVATEQVTDDSCQTYQMKRVTSFTKLIDRLSSPKR
jgi:hypothetical protein